ncbi:hypothetical protein [Luteibacter yeojuensis]|uniref:Uncharacterized protein n=1 Tax=Luteibacter yeojuensis TaxID=345309 RepID=A0A7X5QSA3_9GAMM|nr:hypothetical protein [Luteibacter yeojuensis]NID14382.1 hypothetical protein [Luteibacter yeojuensis]
MSTGRRFTAEELDLAAINAAIARHPFNPHEKSADATRRTVLSLMFKDGYRECEKQTESRVAELVEDADAVLDSAKVIEVNFQPSDYYSVPKKYLDALHEALSKFRGE